MSTGHWAHGLVEVGSAAELTELLGAPLPAVAAKERAVLHEPARQWLARSPFCLVATAGPDGSCDVSPKGDPPGFTLVLDDSTLAIPDRPGNRRVDGFRNILGNPHVGLLYLIPGRADTLRVNGRARLVRDAPFFDRMVVDGHRPAVAVVVEVEQVFFHCAKAFLRAQVWDPATWRPEAVPSRARIVHAVERPDDSLADVERHYGPQYARRLYG